MPTTLKNLCPRPLTVPLLFGGATMDDLKLMVANFPKSVQVKAAGGGRDLDTLLQVRSLGVTRCGASRTKEMLDEYRRRFG